MSFVDDDDFSFAIVWGDPFKDVNDKVQQQSAVFASAESDNPRPIVISLILFLQEFLHPSSFVV